MGPDKEVELADQQAVEHSQEQAQPSERVEREALQKLSVRDSIKSAFKEQNEKEGEDKLEPREAKAPKESIVKALVKEETQESKVSPESKAETPEAPVVAPIEKAPTGWSKEAVSQWDKLPSEIRQAITKSQKELTDRLSNQGREVAQAKEMQGVLEPYMPAIRQFNATPAQTVKRALEWMDALSGPQKETALLQLAQSFNIRVPQNNQQQQSNPQDTSQYYQPDQQQSVVDPRIDAKLSEIDQRFADLVQRQEQDKQNAANTFVNSWARGKPHFEQVRIAMYGLISTGTIPLTTDGQLDLDSAYAAACRAHPEISALIVAEAEEQRKIEAKAKVDKKAEEDAKKLAAAKKAAGSLKSGAPTTPASSTNQRKPSGSTSVRDSIRGALQELNNS